MQIWKEMGGENQPLEDISFSPADYEASALFWNAANIGYFSLQMRVSYPLAWALAGAEAVPRLSGFQR